MALSEQESDFLKGLYHNLSDDALQPGSEFYEPIYDHLVDKDPVSRMKTLIEFSQSESIQFFSGFSGTGKTTELFRLKGDFTEDYLVLYANALDYINPAEPLHIENLLIALAGALSDKVFDEIRGDAQHESFWTRFSNYLKNTTIQLSAVSVKTKLATPAQEILGTLETGVDLKFELRNGTSFRQKLQTFLASRLKELKNEVDQFVQDCVKLVRNEVGLKKKIVFIFDNLEQIRGTLEDEANVIRSVERIFSNYLNMLKMPFLHVVYTVPPWLKFRVTMPDDPVILPAMHLWRNDPERSRDMACWSRFRKLVRRRLKDDGLKRLFGAPPSAEHPLIDRLIDMSGGHFRDLLRALRQTVLRANSLPSLPVTPGLVENVLNSARSEFLPIAIDDAKWLAEIARIRTTALPSTDADPVNRLSRFIDHHSVLYFVNDTEWYDVHPLIRDEINDVLKAIGEPEK